MANTITEDIIDVVFDEDGNAMPIYEIICDEILEEMCEPDNRHKKNTLSFSCSKVMRYLRTPVELWQELSKEFAFTVDLCASHQNHLVDKYYTAQNDCLEKDWNGEIAYLHPLFDMKIPNYVKKASESKGTFVMLLPASTHTKYFHDYLYKKDNVEIRFLKKPPKGFRFLNDDGSADGQSNIGYIKPLMICVMVNE